MTEHYPICDDCEEELDKCARCGCSIKTALFFCMQVEDHSNYHYCYACIRKALDPCQN